MSFPIPITSVLTGATVRQLAYWRRHTPATPPLLVPEAKHSGRYLYSWADIVALRSIVYLRQEKSLPQIRRAVATLQELEANQWTHLAAYQLISTHQSILVQTPTGQLLDLEDQPGTVLHEIPMHDVLAPFQTRNGRAVPALEHPRPRIVANPKVLGGYPVIAGTRIPFDIIASLAENNLKPNAITTIYPSVDHEAINDAISLAKQVAAMA